jgi:hypothetical protein
MLVEALERVPLDGLMPLQHLPEDEPDRVNVDLLVVLGVSDPELGRLPVDRADERANHRASGRLDLRGGRTRSARPREKEEPDQLTLARPKSLSLATPSAVMRTLDDLMSRWMTMGLCVWRYSRPREMPSIISSIERNEG